MATTIVLTNPPDYDLQALAETTRQSLALLKPWTLLDTTNDPLAPQIVSQAAKYVSAIQLGVSAAYSGFTVTEEVLFLASALPIEDKDDLHDYLVGMMDLAREARENSNKAYQAFRNVRQEIFMTMNDLQEEKNSSQNEGIEGSSSTHRRFPEHTLDDIEVLVKFSESISRFANWWDWVKIETDPSCVRSQPISFQLDTLQDPGTVKRWTHLRGQYTAYVQLISELEDADPSFFRRASSSDMRRGSGSGTPTPAGLIESTPSTITEGTAHILGMPMVAEPESMSSSNTSTQPENQEEQKHSTGPEATTSVALTDTDVKKEKPRPLRKKFIDHCVSKVKPGRLINYIKRTLQHRSKDAGNGPGEKIPHNFWKAGWPNFIHKKNGGQKSPSIPSTPPLSPGNPPQSPIQDTTTTSFDLTAGSTSGDRPSLVC